MTDGQARAIHKLARMGAHVEKLDNSPDGCMTFNYSIRTPDGRVHDASVTTLVLWCDYLLRIHGPIE